MKQISKIVLTGGPCAGKTTGMSWIVNNLAKLGYKVFIVSETATELMSGGATPAEIGNAVDFQAELYQLLKAKEKAYEDLAQNVKEDRVLIICDRGSLDAEAFLTDEEIELWHKDPRVNATSTQMMEDYDAVFHLTTAAKGASEYYTTENNPVRHETPAEAILADDRIIAAWTGHPHFRVIDNYENFDFKLKKLLEEITSFLGEPNPMEIERKFLIEYPDTDYLESLPNCQRVEILQTYLNNEGEDEIRLRQRGDGDSFMYIKTTKKKITDEKRLETEKRLSEKEYCKELMNSDISKHQIRKTRYCLTYNSTYFEIDIYPFWYDQAIMEVEYTRDHGHFEIPDFISVIADVTEVEKYKNYNLAELY